MIDLFLCYTFELQPYCKHSILVKEFANVLEG